MKIEKYENLFLGPIIIKTYETKNVIDPNLKLTDWPEYNCLFNSITV